MSERPGSIIQAVADHALAEAVELEKEAATMEDRARFNRSQAALLRSLHALASAHAVTVLNTTRVRLYTPPMGEG